MNQPQSSDPDEVATDDVVEGQLDSETLEKDAAGDPAPRDASSDGDDGPKGAANAPKEGNRG